MNDQKTDAKIIQNSFKSDPLFTKDFDSNFEAKSAMLARLEQTRPDMKIGQIAQSFYALKKKGSIYMGMMIACVAVSIIPLLFHYFSTIKMNDINEVKYGINLCFTRLTQSVLSIQNQDYFSKHLERSYLDMTNDCFFEFKEKVASVFSNDSKADLLVDSLIDQSVNFHKSILNVLNKRQGDLTKSDLQSQIMPLYGKVDFARYNMNQYVRSQEIKTAGFDWGLGLIILSLLLLNALIMYFIWNKMQETKRDRELENEAQELLLNLNNDSVKIEYFFSQIFKKLSLPSLELLTKTFIDKLSERSFAFATLRQSSVTAQQLQTVANVNSTEEHSILDLTKEFIISKEEDKTALENVNVNVNVDMINKVPLAEVEISANPYLKSPDDFENDTTGSLYNFKVEMNNQPYLNSIESEEFQTFAPPSISENHLLEQAKFQETQNDAFQFSNASSEGSFHADLVDLFYILETKWKEDSRGPWPVIWQEDECQFWLRGEVEAYEHLFYALLTKIFQRFEDFSVDPAIREISLSHRFDGILNQASIQITARGALFHIDDLEFFISDDQLTADANNLIAKEMLSEVYGTVMLKNMIGENLEDKRFQISLTLPALAKAGMESVQNKTTTPIDQKKRKTELSHLVKGKKRDVWNSDKKEITI